VSFSFGPGSRGEVDQPSDNQISRILATAKSVAVVGLSDNPDRPSNRIARFLKEVGYKVYPVNPRVEEAVGEEACSTLGEIPTEIDIVDVFRAPDKVLPVVEAAIDVGANTIWMQEGAVNEVAAKRARDAGLQVVMDRCIMEEYRRLLK
jgi:predicted CoA-binding protein